jgi:Ser/Thr protein kinase RdoA (MazF antagonist)
MSGVGSLSELDAAALVAAAFGPSMRSASRLDTERDDSFHVVAAEGEFLFKLAHPDDEASLIDLQSAALAHAASMGLAVQKVVATATIDGRIGRLLSWQPGSPLDFTPSPPEVEKLGAALGALNAALASFDHPAARRALDWDAARLPASRALLAEFPSPEAAEAFARFDARVAPRLRELPRQVIHNDFHQGNILVDRGDERFVTGIIDFGDVTHTARIVDVAVALSYLQHPLGVADESHFLTGFERHVSLTALELQLLPDLVAARFALRLLLNAALQRGTPDNRSDAGGGWERTRAALAAHLERNP